MCLTNWLYHLDNLKRFYDSDMYDICCHDENVVNDLFYGYISSISEHIASDIIGYIYEGENSNFCTEYLVEDFLTYGYAIVPNLADTFQPRSLIPELGAELDYQHGTPLETEDELFYFITKGVLPKKPSKYIPSNFAIRKGES